MRESAGATGGSGDVFAARGPSALSGLEGAVFSAGIAGAAQARGTGPQACDADAQTGVGIASDSREGEGRVAPDTGAGVLPGAGAIAGACEIRVALHYGNPGAEERALARGAAFADFSDREILRLSGTDRLKLLDSLATQRLACLEPGQTRELLLLSPRGHIENQALAADDGESAWLLCDAGHGQALADFLARMRFMMDVEIEPRPDLGAIATYEKPGACDASGESPVWGRAPNGRFLPIGARPQTGGISISGTSPAGAPDLPLWRDPWPALAEGGTLYGPEPERHPARFRALVVAAVPRDSLAETARSLGADGLGPAGSLAAEALRVAAWRPRMRTEGSAKALPHELDWLRTAVHLNKGCYRGQETVAKIVNLGRPPRRLAMLYLEGEYGELPEPGSEVGWNGRAAGTVTSAVRSVDEGPVALALLRRAVPGDAVLEVGEYRAGQRAIVNPEGKSSASPAVRPGAELRGRNLPGAPGGRGLAV